LAANPGTALSGQIGAESTNLAACKVRGNRQFKRRRYFHSLLTLRRHHCRRFSLSAAAMENIAAGSHYIVLP
jgi:hypothetical protein